MEVRMDARGVKRSETEEEEEKGNNLKKGNTYEEVRDGGGLKVHLSKTQNKSKREE